MVTKPPEFPWSNDGIYVYNHRIDWHLSEGPSGSWRDFLGELGCKITENSEGAWTAICRVLPVELNEWKHYLIVRAHDRCEGEHSVHLTLERTPVPLGTPPTEVLEETRRAKSIEDLLRRLTENWPIENDVEKQTADTSLLVYFESTLWEARLARLNLVPPQRQYRGVLLQPRFITWAVQESGSLTEITAYSSQYDARVLHLAGECHFSRGDAPFEKTQKELWSELCSLFENGAST